MEEPTKETSADAATEKKDESIAAESKPMIIVQRVETESSSEGDESTDENGWSDEEKRSRRGSVRTETSDEGSSESDSEEEESASKSEPSTPSKLSEAGSSSRTSTLSSISEISTSSLPVDESRAPALRTASSSSLPASSADASSSAPPITITKEPSASSLQKPPLVLEGREETPWCLPTDIVHHGEA